MAAQQEKSDLRNLELFKIEKARISNERTKEILRRIGPMNSKLFTNVRGDILDIHVQNQVNQLIGTSLRVINGFYDSTNRRYNNEQRVLDNINSLTSYLASVENHIEIVESSLIQSDDIIEAFDKIVLQRQFNPAKFVIKSIINSVKDVCNKASTQQLNDLSLADNLNIVENIENRIIRIENFLK